MEPTRNLTLLLQRSRNIFFAITDMQGQCTYVNDLFSTTFATPGKDMAVTRFMDFILPEDLPAYRRIEKKLLQSPGEVVAADLCTVAAGGDLLQVNWELRIFSQHGQPAGMQALGSPHSRKPKATPPEELREKLSRVRYLLRTLIDHLPDYITVKDLNSRHIISNRAHLAFAGVTMEEELIGKIGSDYLSETSAKEQLENEQSALRSGLPGSMEEGIITRAGEKKWLMTTRVPLQDEDSTIVGLVCISRDITAMKNIEESLRRSIERFNIVSSATNDVIWDWDLINDHILWNDSATTLFGASLETIDRDRHWWQNHIHPNDRERVLSKIYHHIEQGLEGWQDEYRVVCTDGSLRNVLDRGYIVLGPGGESVRMIGTMTDLTERKKLEAELANTNLARQRLVTEATIMAQERERAEIGRELHDNINQILTTTKMYLDMALSDREISEELTTKSHENISTAIEEIRALSKSLVPPSLGDIGLKAAIAEMINNLHISPRIEIGLKATGLAGAAIPANVQLMVFRIVQEQLNNILKHSKATRAEIRLAAVKDKKMLHISVSDNGVGFDTRKRPRGIGLMNITSRAELHDGDVEIVSSPGKGCTVKISIPI